MPLSRLRAIRQELRLSQAGLARRAGLQQQLVSQIERGLEPLPKHVAALAAALNVSVDVLSTQALEARTIARISDANTFVASWIQEVERLKARGGAAARARVQALAQGLVHALAEIAELEGAIVTEENALRDDVPAGA